MICPRHTSTDHDKVYKNKELLGYFKSEDFVGVFVDKWRESEMDIKQTTHPPTPLSLARLQELFDF